MNGFLPAKSNILESLGRTAPGLHDSVIRLLDSAPRGKLLDAPAGEGRLSYLLKEKGFDVLAADIDETMLKAPGIPFRRADLNTKLPFDANSFDIAACIEGIEHIENPFHLCRELSRILVPGGILVLSTPNILSIDSRIRFMLTGWFSFFGGYYADERKFYTYHTTPMHAALLRLALVKAGLSIDSVATNRPVTAFRPWWTRPLLHALGILSAAIVRTREPEGPVRRLLSSPAVLMGEILIFRCVKEA